MLTSNDLLIKIDSIIERAYLDFTYLIVGEDFFTTEQKTKIESLGLILGQRPLLELLYILVRNRPTEGYRKDKTLLSLLDEIAQTGVLPVLNDTHQATIDNSKAHMNEAIETTKSELTKKIKHEIIKVNNDFKNELAVERITTVPNLEEKKDKYGMLILGALVGIGIASQSTFVKGLTSVLTDTINNAVVDEVTSKVAGDPIVYKQTVSDQKRCQFCFHAYVGENGKPREYRLSELVANGSNYGLPKSGWKAVVGAHHVNCRCQLHYKT